MELMTGYVDPDSDLVKAVLVDKASGLATDALERLIEDADRRGLPRDEALEICGGVLEELRARNEPDHVFQSLCEAVDTEIERRS
jgi:hypothetical protein